MTTLPQDKAVFTLSSLDISSSKTFLSFNPSSPRLPPAHSPSSLNSSHACLSCPIQKQGYLHRVVRTEEKADGMALNKAGYSRWPVGLALRMVQSAKSLFITVLQPSSAPWEMPAEILISLQFYGISVPCFHQENYSQSCGAEQQFLKDF